VWKFRKINGIEGERETVEKGLVLQVKCPSLLTNHNRTNTNGSACEVSDSFGVSERSVK